MVAGHCARSADGARAVGNGRLVPKFDQYPSALYAGRRAPLRLVGHDRTFRTRPREAYTAEINFGGRYILTVWGCGAECLMATAIDTTTGRVAWTPFTLCCFGSITDQDVEPVIARPTSRLAVFTGLRNESGTLEPESTVFVFR